MNDAVICDTARGDRSGAWLGFKERSMDTAKITVLVIDDQSVDRELAVRMLDSQFRVLQADSVEAGLAIYRAENVDCVLLDHHMPGMAGLDGLRRFAAEKAVVVMVTGSDNDLLAAEAFKRGARDYVLKRSMSGAVVQRIVMREVERRRLERELQASQLRFDEVAARIGEVLWVRGLDGEFLYLSPAFERVWGRPRAGMTLAVWESLVHPDDRAKGHTTAAWANGIEHVEDYRIVRPDGQVRHISNRGYPIYEAGRLARVGGIARDITEETRVHAQLRLAQKLEAIGQLAAGVAHEINTPAQYVGDNITFFEQGFRDLAPLLEACARGPQSVDAAAFAKLVASADLDYLVKEIPDAIRQAAAGIAQIKKIVQAMKEFSHPADDMTTVNLNRAIENTATVAKNEWKYVAELVLELAPDLPPVMCYPSEVNQVVLNLVVNAAHAIADVVGSQRAAKGVLKIATRVEGQNVVIEVTDTGGGIPHGIRHKIFDPFFTTKGIGKGTGQGLAIAHRIVVEHHGGTIDFESEIGKGTRFMIRLPIEGIAHDEAPREEVAA
jgi:PAS domain S-box-containing protein